MIELRKITEENFEECIGLEPKEEQKSFVARNVRSLAEAYVALANGEHPLPYAIYNGDTMVGFILLLYSESENAYWICRLMIDERFQGKGCGKESMKTALDLIRTFPCGKAESVFLSYEPENIAAKKLYASLGFVETGEIQEDEIIAKLNL